MTEKFLCLSKKTRALVLILAWLVTCIGFVGCILIKNYYNIMWLEVILTTIGILIGIVSLWLSIIYLTSDDKK